MNPRPSYQLGHNQFSDMTLEEYQAYNKLGKYSPGIVTPRSSSVREAPSEDTTTSIKLRNRGRRQLQNLPESVDWVEKGAVVPVKNQGTVVQIIDVMVFYLKFVAFMSHVSFSSPLCTQSFKRHVW